MSTSINTLFMECIDRQDRSFNQERFLVGLSKILSRDWFKCTWVYKTSHLTKLLLSLFVETGRVLPARSSKRHTIWPNGILRPLIFLMRSLRHHCQILSAWFLRMLRNRFIINDLGDRTHFKPFTFLEAVHAAMLFDVSNPRDKIYSVLGFLDQETSKAIVSEMGINYQKPVGHVFRDAIVPILVTERNPSVYAYFRILTPPERDALSTPSWVVDLHPGVSHHSGFL
jgi:hypothetical protein